MIPGLPQLEISTPTEPLLPGRGFYQLEEDALYVQIGPSTQQRAFFSWLESDQMRLEFDRAGRLIFAEIRLARRRWTVDTSLDFPDSPEMADVRWLDFRRNLPPAQLLTNLERSLLEIRLTDDQLFRCFQIADQVTAAVDRDHCLTSLWIDGIVDDLAGREIGAFRKHLRDTLANPADDDS